MILILQVIHSFLHDFFDILDISRHNTEIILPTYCTCILPMNNNNHTKNNATTIEGAFDFDSTIQPVHVHSTFSPTCIFCHNTNTQSLIPDGSFRKCLSCNKQFRPTFLMKHPNASMVSENRSYKIPTFQTMRPNFEPLEKNKWNK
jgi:hypothetical protein